MANPADKEIWKNVSAGLRHYICLNAIGEQISKTVGPGRTFTISAIERRLNQEVVYAPEADLFRNGNFILVKETEDTVRDEVDSPDSVTDDEITKAIQEAMGEDSVPIEAMLARITGINTAQRIFEEAVSMDAPQSIVSLARAKVEELEELPVDSAGNPIAVGNREVVDRAAANAPRVKDDSKWTTKME